MPYGSRAANSTTDASKTSSGGRAARIRAPAAAPSAVPAPYCSARANTEPKVRLHYHRDSQHYPVRTLQWEHLAEDRGHADAEHEADREHRGEGPANLL